MKRFAVLSIVVRLPEKVCFIAQAALSLTPDDRRAAVAAYIRFSPACSAEHASLEPVLCKIQMNFTRTNKHCAN